METHHTRSWRSIDSLKSELDHNWNSFQDPSDLLRWLLPRLGGEVFFGPTRKDLLTNLGNKSNRCPLCFTLSVLYSRTWDGTLGAIFFHLCDHFMRTGELYYPNLQLPKKLNSHRGYHALRYWFHALQHPKLIRGRKPSWLPTTAGLNFVLGDNFRSPYIVFTNKQVVLGASYVSPEMRKAYAEAGGGQVVPDDLTVTFSQVLSMRGYNIDLIWGFDRSDLQSYDLLVNSEAKTKIRKLRCDCKKWMEFWYDHLMLHGGWEKLEELTRQQRDWKRSVDMFELERANSLAWRKEHLEVWQAKAARSMRIILERGCNADQ